MMPAEEVFMEKRDWLCGICPAGCFVTGTFEEGRLVAVEPQEGHRLGMTPCIKGTRVEGL